MTMNNDMSDIQSAIAKLEAKRNGLNIAIAELRALAGLPPESDSEAQTVTPPQALPLTVGDNTGVRSDAFFGHKIPSAARKYLEMMKRPQTTRKIADALEKGGILHQSKNFTATVHTSMSRDSKVVRVGDGWGLAAWYPGKLKHPRQQQSVNDSEDNDKDQSSIS